MSNILAIETTTKNCSVSIFKDGELIILKENISEKYSHSEELTVFIESVMNECKLKPADLDAVAISKGPGSYTGLRIGTASAKGLCYALDIPLISISTLEVMSYSVSIKYESDYYCPMIDARRMEVFTKIYDFKLKELSVDRALILEKDSFDKFKNNDIYFFGNGSDKYKDMVTRKNFIFIKNIFSDSRYMGKLAFDKYKLKDFENLSTFEPNYIKDFYLIKRKGKWMRS